MIPHLRGGRRCPRRRIPRLNQSFVRLNQLLSCQTLLPLETTLAPLTGQLSQHRGFHFFRSTTVQNTFNLISETDHLQLLFLLTYFPSKMVAPALVAMIQIQVKEVERGGKISRYCQHLVRLSPMFWLSNFPSGICDDGRQDDQPCQDSG